MPEVHFRDLIDNFYSLYRYHCTCDTWLPKDHWFIDQRDGLSRCVPSLPVLKYNWKMLQNKKYDFFFPLQIELSAEPNYNLVVEQPRASEVIGDVRRDSFGFDNIILLPEAEEEHL